MKTLVITVIQPSHEDNGTAIRTMNFIRYFASVGTVDLIYRINMYEDIAEHPCRLFEKIPENRGSLIDKLLYLIRHPLSFPVCIKNEYSLAAENYVNELIMREKYDLIFVRYGHNVVFLRGLSLSIRQRIIVDLDDLYLGNLFIYYRVTTRYKLKRILDKVMLYNYEQACCKEFGRMILCSEQDKSKYLALHNKISSKRVAVIPNIIRPPENVISKDHASVEKPIMLFIGALDYWANREGLEWFLKEIYDVYKSMFGKGHFWIVGRRPPQEFKNFINSDKTIKLFEDVSDLNPLYERADFIIVPLLSGSGTRIKLLEAALYKRPVVTTPVGSEGLDMENGKEIFKFSNKDDFKSAMVNIMQPDVYQRLVSNAYNYVNKQYSVEQFNSSVSEMVSSLPK